VGTAIGDGGAAKFEVVARWAHWGGAAGAVGKQIYSSDCKPL